MLDYLEENFLPYVGIIAVAVFITAALAEAFV